MPDKSTDPRHNSRVIVLQRLFERNFSNQKLAISNDTEFSSDNLSKIDAITNFDKDLAEDLFNGVITNQQKIDDIISKLAPQWPLDQIARTDLQLLRMAITEGFILRITPEKVAIDEALELAKEFTNSQSRKFVNGVLGNLIKNKNDFNLVK